MRAAVGVLAVLVGCWSAAAADEKYASDDGKFKVAFPKGAAVASKKLDASGGVKMHLVTARTGGAEYTILFMDLPEAAKDVPAKAVLDSAQKSAVGQGGGKQVKATDRTLGTDKLPARELVVEKAGDKVRTLIVVAKLRVYVVAVKGKDEFATGPEGTAFLDSFEITK